MRFLKLKSIFLIISPLILITILYHYDPFYLSFEKNVNRRLIKYFNFNPLKGINIIAHELDIRTFFSSKTKSPSQKDFVNIYVEDSLVVKYKEIKNSEKKTWDRAELKIYDSLYDVKIKLHGRHINHYLNNKFSYTIKIKPNNKSYFGMYKFKLIKSEEWDARKLAINNLANAEGLISSKGRLVILKINDKIVGEYALVEHHWSKSFLKNQYNIDKFSVLRNASGLSSKAALITGDWHRSEYDLEPEKIVNKSKKDPFFSKALSHYSALSKMIKENKIDSIKQYFDIDYTAHFFAFQSLFNSFHFTNGDNLQLLFNHENKKFYFLYRQEHTIRELNNNKDNWRDCTFPNFNKILFNSMPFMQGSPHHKLYMKLLSNNEFRNKRDKYLNVLINKSDSIKSYLESFIDKSCVTTNYTREKSRRVEKIKKIKLLNNFEILVNIASDYLNYSKIYISWFRQKNIISVISDAFSQINIKSLKLKCEDTLMNGIEFDNELSWKNNKYYFKLKNDSVFNPIELDIYNNVTGSKIDIENFNVVR
jgi:hypothetical protein